MKAHGKVHNLEVNKPEPASVPCTVCSKSVSNKYFLRHREFVHGDNKTEPCSKYGKEISNFAIKRHEKICLLSKEKEKTCI